jgi:hypothetical protein
MAEAFTLTVTHTPLYQNPATERFLRKYTGANIVVSGSGLVHEATDQVALFIAAVVASSDPLTGASVLTGDIPGRQAVSLRVDRDTDRFCVFRNGVMIGEESLAGVGSVANPSDLIIGPGHEIHGLSWHTSALSDAVIGATHAEGLTV